MSERIYDTIINSEPITKGWSGDKKYCVITTDDMKYLLRIFPVSRYESRNMLFELMEQAEALDVPMCTPIECGICDEGVYWLQSWIDGEDLEAVLHTFSEAEQYVYGVKAGEILRKIHSVPALGVPSERPDWAVSFDHSTYERIEKYHSCGLRFDGDEPVLEFLTQNKSLIENRPQNLQHGDYSIRNMMLEKGELKIIDFERLYFGDPWEDFVFNMLEAAKNSYFTTGQFHGYFGGEPSEEFWRTYAFYIYSSLLPGMYELDQTDTFEKDRILKQTAEILRWFESIGNPVPTWYLKGYEVCDVLDTDGNKTRRFHERGKPMNEGKHHLEVHVGMVSELNRSCVERNSNL
ncbi:MAG: phosphotransferase [Oscillospiraceae bacterium]|nr:phosphotransferase [Oscillospiraceae bacterium]